MFREVPISDNFNRADADPITGDWTLFHNANVKTLSNQYAPSTSGQQSIWTYGTGTFANVAARFDFSTASGGHEAGVYLRLSGTNNADKNGYHMFVDFDGTLLIRRYDAGALTLLTSVTGSIAGGDRLGFEAIGNQFVIYKNGGEVLRASDSTYVSGKVAVALYSGGGTDRLDNFGVTERNPILPYTRKRF